MAMHTVKKQRRLDHGTQELVFTQSFTPTEATRNHCHLAENGKEHMWYVHSTHACLH